MRFLGRADAFFVAVVLLTSFMLVSPLSAHAVYEPPLVQQASGGCVECDGTSSTAMFGADVTSGDLIVVGISSGYEPTGAGSFSVSDTLDSAYTQAVVQCNTPGLADCAAIFFGTAPSSGADTVTVTVNNADDPISLDIFIYELTGVTAAGYTTGTGSGLGDMAGPATAMEAGAAVPQNIPEPISVSTGSTSFSNEAFLLGVVNVGVIDPIFTPGAGFTASPPSTDSGRGFAEYALSGISSPTTFPGTLSEAGSFWSEVGLALSYPSSTTPSCPSSFGGLFMPIGATYTDQYGNTWTAPGGYIDGGAYSSFFFAGPITTYPPPMQSGWSGVYGMYNGQQGWIVSFYCS